MTEALPISCISCRRKKIKCNKLKPCNQCQKRHINCEFPSTFRNIKINEDELEESRAEYNPSFRPSNDRQYSDRTRSKSSSSQGTTSASPLSSGNTSSDSNHRLQSHQQHNYHSSSQSLHHHQSHSSTDLAKLNEEVELLRNEKLTILQDNFQLNQKNHQLLTRLTKFDRSVNSDLPKFNSGSSNRDGSGGSGNSGDHGGHDHFAISGETSEMGEKYYGPQSSNFMIKALKKKSKTDEMANKVKYSKPNDLITFGDSSSENKYSSDVDKSNDHEHDSDSNLTHDSSSHTVSSSSNLIEQSLLKKPLPFLLKIDPDLSADSDTSFDWFKLNFQIISKLVELFFINTSYYRSFISKETVFTFLSNYESIRDKEWENDDDLLLLYMILLLSIQRLTPKEFIEMNLMSNTQESIKRFKKFKTHLLNKVLYHNFEKLRHNLINESIITIQAYILCTEWYFIDQRYEESWSMLFHTCSIAYSIGLHVMGRFRTTSDDSNANLDNRSTIPKSQSNDHSMNVDEKTGNNDKIQVKKEPGEEGSGTSGFESLDYEAADEDNDIARFKVWFALKNISGQLCSVLGRPNPISIQVNSIVLKSNNEKGSSKIDLSAHKTQVLLKIGLSECLRLSNMMLIENFMINFTMNDLLNLDARFQKEIKLLEWFLSDEYEDDDETEQFSKTEGGSNSAGGNDSSGGNGVGTGVSISGGGFDVDSSGGDQLSYDEGNHLPLKIDQINIIIDLIIFYINRAKLFEPFINQFQEKHDAAVITRSLLYSIMKFLDYTIEFIQRFLNNFSEKYLNYEYQILNEIKFGKLFRIYYPFLNSFIYQGIIVIFTFLNYKSNDFVHCVVNQSGEQGHSPKEPQISQLQQSGSTSSDVHITVDNEGPTENISEGAGSNSSASTHSATATIGPSSDSSIDYNSFLRQLENKLNALLQFDRRVSQLLNQSVRLWSTNIVYLINKNVQKIELIYEKQKIEKQKLEEDLRDLRNQIVPQMVNESTSKVSSNSAGRHSSDQSMNSNSESSSAYQPEPDVGSFAAPEAVPYHKNPNPNDLANAVSLDGSVPGVGGGDHRNQDNLATMQGVSDMPQDDEGFESLLGFNMRDPFWLTNPDNLPYYLSSPSDDGDTMPNKKPKTESVSAESSNKPKNTADFNSRGFDRPQMAPPQISQSDLFTLNNLTPSNQVGFGHLYPPPHDPQVVGMPPDVSQTVGQPHQIPQPSFGHMSQHQGNPTMPTSNAPPIIVPPSGPVQHQQHIHPHQQTQASHQHQHHPNQFSHQQQTAGLSRPVAYGNLFDPNQPTGVFQTYQRKKDDVNSPIQLFNQQMDVNARPPQSHVGSSSGHHNSLPVRVGGGLGLTEEPLLGHSRPQTHPPMNHLQQHMGPQEPTQQRQQQQQQQQQLHNQQQHHNHQSDGPFGNF